MIFSYLRSNSILKNVIVSQKVIEFFNSPLNLFKYYIIIGTMLLSIASSFILVPIFAESSLTSSSMINSSDIETLFNEASTLYKQQKYGEALQYYDKVLAINSSNANVLNDKASVLRNLQKYDEALQYFDKVLAIEPSNFIALGNKANILKDLQKHDEVIEH